MAGGNWSITPAPSTRISAQHERQFLFRQSRIFRLGHGPREIRVLLFPRKNPQRVIAPKQNFFCAHGVGYLAVHAGVIQQRAGRGVKKNILQIRPHRRIQRQQWQQPAPVGKNKGHLRMPARDVLVIPQRGVNPPRIIPPRRLRHMEIYRHFLLPRPRQHFFPIGFIHRKTLRGRKHLPHPAKSGVPCPPQILQRRRPGQGLDARKRAKPVRIRPQPLGHLGVVPYAGFMILPVPAQQHAAPHARGVHRLQHFLAVGKSLKGLFSVRSRAHQFRPVMLIARPRPSRRVGKNLRRIGVRVGVNHARDHARFGGWRFLHSRNSGSSWPRLAGNSPGKTP